MVLKTPGAPGVLPMEPEALDLMAASGLAVPVVPAFSMAVAAAAASSAVAVAVQTPTFAAPTPEVEAADRPIPIKHLFQMWFTPRGYGQVLAR